jgi:hypothetical protein
MRRTRWQRIRVLGCAVGLVAVTAAAAQTTGRTALGGDFMSGGIGEGEIATMQAQRGNYALWVRTAAKGSGAYLSDVHVRIADAKKAIVFNHVLDGPWLLVDLPPGRYEVQASYHGQTFSRATTVHAGDRHQMVFYFDVVADVLPKGESG